jgi:alpha-tubulin suppressor-like RCC1 family protein
VTFGGAPLAGATAIAASGERTCVLAPDGVRCWAAHLAVAAEPSGMQGRATFLAVGAQHACASFVAPREVRCAGEDDRGQAAGRSPVLASATVVGLTAGTNHTCAVLEDGSVQCWGANDAGQLGDGTTRDSRVPARVDGLPPAIDVRAGASFTCARLRNNTVACWGANNAYQLANGTADARRKPAAVTGILGAQELVVAGDSACARLTDGSVRCWGSNDNGQLGDGTTTAHAVPMPVKAAPLAPAK